MTQFLDPNGAGYQYDPNLYTNELSGQYALDAAANQQDPFAQQGSSTPQFQLPDQSQGNSGLSPLSDVYLDPTTGKTIVGPGAIGMPRYSYVPDPTSPNGYKVVVNPGVPAPRPDNFNMTVPPNAGGPIGQMTPTVMVAPQYFNGDEYKPGGLAPAAMVSLQQQLAQGGFYGVQSPNSTTPLYTPGVWSSRDISAYRTALMMANQSGMPVDQVLSQQAAVGAQAQAEAQKRFATPITVTNSADIAAAARKVAPDIIGRFLTPDEEKQLSGAFQGMQASDEQRIRATESAAAAGKVSNNAVVERPPARGIRTIEDLLRQQHPQEYGAHQIGQVGQILLNMLSKAPAGFEAPGTTSESRV